MSEYHGDIDLGDTVQWLFTTVNGSGVPTILTGSPTATAYTDGGVTQSATGVTLTADFDGVTGQNLISIVATGGNGFAAGENIEIVLDAGTVDGNTVVGYAIGGFSIANRSPLRPTTIGRTLDILATGEVPIDFDTSIGTLAAAQIEASALDGKGDWNVGKTGYTLTQSFPTNFADMSITVTTGLVDITQTAADKVWGTGTRVLTAGTNLNDIAAADVWAVDATGQQTQGTFGQAIGDPGATAKSLWQATVSDAAGVSVSADVIAVKAETALIVADTNELQTDDVPGLIATAQADLDIITGAAGALLDTTATSAQLVNDVWDEAMVETTGAPAVTGTFRAALQWMFALSRNKITQNSTTTTLRNDADGADLATSTVSDDATTYTRGEWST